mgnify:CR=1 FL=1
MYRKAQYVGFCVLAFGFSCSDKNLMFLGLIPAGAVKFKLLQLPARTFLVRFYARRWEKGGGLSYICIDIPGAVVAMN